MNRKNQNKRREFLNNVCPTVAMAFLGVSLLESCSSGDDDIDVSAVFSIGYHVSTVMETLNCFFVSASR